MKTRCFPPPAQCGFTLIELLVTLAIAVVLAMVAVPSFEAFRRNAQLTSASNSLMAGLNAARSEAMKKGTNAMLSPVDPTGSWNSGWFVFSFGASNTSQVFNSATDNVVLRQDALPAYMTVNGTGSAFGGTPYVMFDASGYSKLKNGGFGAVTLNMTRSDLTGAALLEQTRRIKIASVGRVRICRPKTATDIDCSATLSD